MKGASQATRCPACKTVFRVVADQLRVSEGWVRCGRCSEVFDATKELITMDGSWIRLNEDSAADAPSKKFNEPTATSPAAAQRGPVAPGSPAAHDNSGTPSTFGDLDTPARDSRRLAGKIELAKSRAQLGGMASGAKAAPFEPPPGTVASDPTARKPYIPPTRATVSGLGGKPGAPGHAEPRFAGSQFSDSQFSDSQVSESRFSESRFPESRSPELPPPGLAERRPAPTANSDERFADSRLSDSRQPDSKFPDPRSARPADRNETRTAPQQAPSSSGVAARGPTPLAPGADDALSELRADRRGPLPASNNTTSTTANARTDPNFEQHEPAALAGRPGFSNSLFPEPALPALEGPEFEVVRELDHLRGENPSLSDFEPSAAVKPGFVRQAERNQLWRQPHMHMLLVGALLLAALALTAQVALAYRDTAAARLPMLKPWLQSACVSLGCRVQAARSIDSMVVESSGLVRVDKTNLYKLQVTLRNRADLELALPALDVSFTDSRGELIARKVITPQELGSAAGTLGAGREFTLQTTLQNLAQGSGQSTEAVAGYTVDLFYP